MESVNKSRVGRLTVIIPAYNERDSIAATIRSLKTQTIPPFEIIVVDDCSTDGTGEIARSLGVTTIRPSLNTGYKSGACNLGLKSVCSEFVMVVDADTVVSPDAINLLLRAFNDPNVAAVGGFIFPKYRKTLWERARYLEYLMAFVWFKFIQERYNCILVSSGCFSAFRTELLIENGGWNPRTIAEDMDLTWSFYKKGYRVTYVPEAICYTTEPKNFAFMRRQLRRWSHGFIQCIKLNWRDLLEIPYMGLFAITPLVDAIFSVMILLCIPIIAFYYSNPFILLLYFIDFPTVFFTVFSEAKKRKEIRTILSCFPSFLIMKFIYVFFIIEAMFSELVIRKKLDTFEKGH
jgi:cellulose synthase/poly-beta-1,6-N-acetylglucosamine synthase-like glycosyltransferase